MISNLEALIALGDTGTMTEAATCLRLSQSAISKRIAALEDMVGQPLVEPFGRKVKLTPYAIGLIQKTGPLMTDLKVALKGEPASRAGRIVMGVSESILSSWGPELLQRACRNLQGLQLVVNAHRSPVAIDRVRSGEYMLALCAGLPVFDLNGHELIEEPMVVVPSRFEALAPDSVLEVLTIEAHSETWGNLGHRIKQSQSRWNFEIRVRQTLQSFTCIVQMARSGFGHGLVPLGVARSMGVPEDRMFHFPDPVLTRPICLIGRSSTLARPLVASFARALRRWAKPGALFGQVQT